MMRPLALTALFLVTACSDSAQVLVPQPDSGNVVDAGVDAALDVALEADGQTVDVSNDATDAGCPTGFETCNGTCVDVSTYQTDSKSCGYCSHDCLGNTCTGGLCAPDLIGTNLPNPNTLAVDSANVYFTTQGATVSTTSGSVYQCPVTGCPSTLSAMTNGLNNPNTIAVDSTTVYWDNTGDLSIADGSVMSCPIAGCGVKDAKRKTLASKLQFILGLAVDSSNVYFGVWGATPYYGKASIDSCPLGGCAGSPSQVVTGQSKPLFVVRDASNVYMAVAGGGAGVPFVETGTIPGPSTGTRLYTGNAIMDSIQGFAIFGGSFFFADNFANAIEVCPLSGCPTNGLVVASTTPSPTSLAVDAKGMYWLDNNGVEYCPIVGCKAPILLATSVNVPQNLAIAGSFVYWVEQDGTGSAGQVLRVAR